MTSSAHVACDDFVTCGFVLFGQTQEKNNLIAYDRNEGGKMR
ncbi:hypothetical protein GTCCBUS3UF5_26410 [Geobacillus thermoleovorans CCB_US3_UF5]|uniref:Uncharacterized protein n=1 Tax=Geobacillus thermoleovorans CCB_US3_UF5 TaxID=1111068 RepID=A0ABN3ZW78_GEOTH|nr:hypothetical protein GTCCBUS3UF5_26410 [Geobacillus thermoleovorans CCB_US3_UF5]GAJ58302.1 hypothetical protein B23_1508 [Geobacillus thermoleovorans B23]